MENYLNVEDLWSDFERALGHLKVKSMINPTTMEAMFDINDVYDDDAGAAEYYCAIESAVYPAIEIPNELPRRFRMWIESLTLDNPSKPFENLINNRNKVLNFNYTEFIETLYGVDHKNVCYIHGCRVKQKFHPKEELILGHSPDEFDEEYGYIDDTFPSYIKDEGLREFISIGMADALPPINWYEESTTKNCSQIISTHKGFFDSLKNIKRIVTIGHSLSDVDHPYFKEIIKSSDNKLEWYIGCHGIRDLNNLDNYLVKMRIPKSNVMVFRT